MILITRGLPGSGKTTAARMWQREDPTRRVYTDRDDLRLMLFDRYGLLPVWMENMVSAIQHFTVRDALERGLDVAVADTNLRDDRLEPLLEIAAQFKTPVRYLDFRSVDIEMCILRDDLRRKAGGRWVGEKVIRAMAERSGLPTS
jgi:tRNA uridine 5-carbamoylmethylation protein Kti12